MDDFDTFKASRQKIDPTARKFSERQWQKAYAAYRRSRERVKEGGPAPSGKGHSSKRRKNGSSGGASYGYTDKNQVMDIRGEVRRNSAYSDLRMIVDLLAWIVIGLVVLTGAMRLVYYTNASAAVVAILQAVTTVVAVVALRLLAHVVIDISDIALRSWRSSENRATGEREASD